MRSTTSLHETPGDSQRRASRKNSANYTRNFYNCRMRRDVIGISPCLKFCLEWLWFVSHTTCLLSYLIGLCTQYHVGEPNMLYDQITLGSQVIAYATAVILNPRKSLKCWYLEPDNNLVYCLLYLALWLAALGHYNVFGASLLSIIYSLMHVISFFERKLLEYLPLSLTRQALISERILHVQSSIHKPAILVSALLELAMIPQILWRLTETVLFNQKRSISFSKEIVIPITIVVLLKQRFRGMPLTRVFI